MSESDYFAWSHNLECPPSACNATVKKKLRKGLLELLWNDIANATFPAKQATTIRKNLLLYKLKHGISDKLVHCKKNLRQLRTDRGELSRQIMSLEEEYEQQDFIVRQKATNLKNIKSQYLLAKVRTDLLGMKHSQTSTQLCDCDNMRRVCQHLMPSTCKELDPNVMRQMLLAVSSLSSSNKKEVWNTVSTTLDNFDVSTLWLHLYQNLLEETDNLIKQDAAKTVDIKSSDEIIETDIAKVCGQHICIVAKRLLCEARANKQQHTVLEFIEQVEAASTNSMDISEWLAMALEVRKLEVEQKSLQNEVDRIQEEIHQNNTLHFDLIQLTSDIQSIDVEIEEYIPDIQQDLVLLKSVPMLTVKMKERLCMELQKIIAIRADDYDSAWLDGDLNTELDMFFDTLNINALRKIMLKGDIGSYRHKKCCFDEASVSITSTQAANIISYFPMIHIPIYSLIECYKDLTAMFVYKKFNALLTEDNVDQCEVPMPVQEKNDYDTVELLNLANIASEKTKIEIEQFNEILNAWVNQNVQEVMKIYENTVDNVPFSDWVQRYGLLLYMIQNTA